MERPASGEPPRSWRTRSWRATPYSLRFASETASRIRSFWTRERCSLGQQDVAQDHRFGFDRFRLRRLRPVEARDEAEGLLEEGERLEVRRASLGGGRDEGRSGPGRQRPRSGPAARRALARAEARRQRREERPECRGQDGVEDLLVADAGRAQPATSAAPTIADSLESLRANSSSAVSRGERPVGACWPGAAATRQDFEPRLRRQRARRDREDVRQGRLRADRARHPADSPEEQRHEPEVLPERVERREGVGAGAVGQRAHGGCESGGNRTTPSARKPPAGP